MIKIDSKLIPMSSYFARHHNILKSLLSMICNCTIETPNACTIKNIISQLAIFSMKLLRLKGFTDLSADHTRCPSANPVLLSGHFEHLFEIFQLHIQAELSFNKPFFRLIEIQIVQGCPDLYLEVNRLSNSFFSDSRLIDGFFWLRTRRNEMILWYQLTIYSDWPSRIIEKWVKVGLLLSRDPDNPVTKPTNKLCYLFDANLHLPLPSCD